MYDDMINNLSAGLGALVWWDLEGTAIRPHDLRAILAAEGEDDSIVPDVDPLKGLRRAVRSYSRGRGHADRYKADIMSETDHHVVITILKRSRLNGDVAWLPVSHLRYDKIPGATALFWQGDGDGVIVRHFERHAHKLMTHLDHQWIRPNLIQKRLNSWSAFPLRRQGGVNFVPSEYLAGVETLQRVIGKIGDSALMVAHVQPSQSSRKSIAKSASTSLENEMTALREQIDAWLAGTHNPRPNTIARVIEDFTALKRRAALYRDSLQLVVDDLNADIAEATEECTALLNMRQESSPDNDRELSGRSISKLRRATEIGAIDGGCVLNAEVLRRAGFGATMINQKWRWVDGGLYARACSKIGFLVEDYTDGEITLTQKAA